ncbi:hypothetical protein JX266_012544 [Neoarthrinium moseri]|nr:hypothetical protein JX266_012544 [Neoarthrinium moseri]
MFDADLFLEDLVKHVPRFCSSFLVSALLFTACQPYTAIDRRASTLRTSFFHEAKALWLGERGTDSVTTAAALQVFSIGCHFIGEDILAKETLQAGRHMAERMGLIRVPPTSAIAESLAHMSPEWVKAASHVAWGIYNWLTLPIPGAVTAALDGNTRLEPLPPYMGRTFPAICGLFRIVQEVAVVYVKRDDARPSPVRVPLAFAEAKYQKLLAWSNTLQAEVVRGEHTPAHVMIFHVWFHCAVLDFFRPFVQELGHDRLSTFYHDDSSPQTVFDASVNQLKQLLLVYHVKYPEARRTCFFNTALVYVSNAILKNPGDPNWRLYFEICIRCWQDLYVCYPIYDGIMQAFLTMALKDELISIGEARPYMDQLRVRGLHHGTTRQVISSFMADLDLALTKPDEAHIHHLASQFDEIMSFDEFIAYQNGT